jgi:hypothetical protein
MRPTRRALLAASILGIAARLAAAAPPTPAPPSRPETYGGAAVSYLRIPAYEFFPGQTGTNYTGFVGDRYSYNNNAIGAFNAPLHLPAGARIVYLELDYFDGTATGAEYGSLDVINNSGSDTQYPVAGAGPGDCLIPGYLCSGNAQANGWSSIGVDLSAENLIVDNINLSYIVYAGNTTLDSTTGLVGMLVGYVLQVSPAPASPTFTDVPTGHPFYQFIEALVASGVTAGCGGGKYCPDAPLTRGQMAVFLAKALGLQFP